MWQPAARLHLPPKRKNPGRSPGRAHASAFQKENQPTPTCSAACFRTPSPPYRILKRSIAYRVRRFAAELGYKKATPKRGQYVVKKTRGYDQNENPPCRGRPKPGRAELLLGYSTMEHGKRVSRLTGLVFCSCGQQGHSSGTSNFSEDWNVFFFKDLCVER